MRYEKDKITIILPCHNEGSVLEKCITGFKMCGFRNILVVDDASKDNTSEVAARMGAEVIKNNTTAGYSITLLKGIYYAKTNIVFVCMPDNIVLNEGNLTEFIEFGLIGNYTMLISERRSARSLNLSKLLKKRFGIFLPEPGFDAVFLNSDIVALIRNNVAGTGTYIYFDIIKQVINAGLKIGVYPIALIDWTRSRLGLITRIRIRFDAKYTQYTPSKYFDYAFPDLEKKQIKKGVIISVTSAILGYLLIRIIEFVASKM